MGARTVWSLRTAEGRSDKDRVMSMSESKGKVLIVEDQFLASEFLRIWTETYGFEVCGVATNAADAIVLARQHNPTHVLMDVRLEGERDGVDAAMAIQDMMPTRIIYCTGSSEPSTVKRIHTDHPFEILFKPIDSRLLGQALMKP
jgi:DNA-binding NarL/FixJ family response regulator